MLESLKKKYQMLKEKDEPVEIRPRGMAVAKRKSTPEEVYERRLQGMTRQEYDREMALRAQEEREDIQDRIDVARQEKGGMSLWHSKKEQPLAKGKYPSPQGVKTEIPTTPINKKIAEINRLKRGIKSHIQSFPEKAQKSISSKKNKNDTNRDNEIRTRKDAEARVMGFRSAREMDELRTQKAAQTYADTEKKISSIKYQPSQRYNETVEEFQYRVALAKRKIKNLATPAGFAGGLIDVIAPKKTQEQMIKEERNKFLKNQEKQKREELLQKRKHEIMVAAAYGSGRIPTQRKVTPRPLKNPMDTYLLGFGGMGGFGGLAQPRPQPRPQSNPFGLSFSGISPVSIPAVDARKKKRKDSNDPLGLSSFF